MTERSWSEMTGEELALAARGGALAPFTVLVERYEGRLFNFLLRRCVCASDAEDLTQETFLRAFRRIDRYDPRWRFSTWLFTIGARLAATRARAEGRRGTRERLAGAEDARAAPAPGPADAAEALDERGRVWAIAQRTLTEDQRSLLWLRYAEDLSMREIATVTGRTEIGVRVALFRARDALAASLGPEAGTPSGAEPSRARRGASERKAAPVALGAASGSVR